MDLAREQQASGRYRWWALSVVALAVFMVTTDSGLLNISLPVITVELGADLTVTSWIAIIYALVTGSLYLPCGRLSDLVGRKQTFSAGFLLYALSSLVAGASHHPPQLIFFRGFQAVGSALMMANTFALVTSLFPPAERGRAMGLSGGMVSAIGYTLGPVLGGLLTHSLGWRSIFYVTAGLGFAGFIASRLLLREEPKRESSRPTRESFDVTGSVGFAAGLVALLFALTTGQRGLWHTPFVQGAFAASISCFGLFIWWESRARHPLLDLRLFRILPFSTGNLARLSSFVTITMNNLIMPFYLQLGLGLDPLRAGALMTPTTIGLAVLSPVAGWLSERIDARRLASAGLIVKAVAFFLLSFLSLGATFYDVVLRLGLLGVGLGLFQTPNNNSLMSSVPTNRLGIASSFLSIVRSVGQSTGAALATTILSASLLAVTGQISLQQLAQSATLGSDSRLLPAFMSGYRYVYLTAAGLCLGGAVASSTRSRSKN